MTSSLAARLVHPIHERGIALNSLARCCTFLVCVSLLWSCGGGGSSPTPTPVTPAPPSPPVTTGPTDSEKLRDELQGLTLDTFYVESFEALGARSPESIAGLGLPGGGGITEAKLDDISEAYQLETFAMHKVVLELLQTYDRSALSAADQLNYDVYEWYLQDEIAREPFMLYDYVATYFFTGVHNSTRRFFTEIHPRGTEQDAVDYITRLTLVGQKFAQAEQLLDLQQQQGIIEPFPSLTIGSNQLSQLANANGESNPYFTGFLDVLNEVPNLSAARRNDLRTRALGAVNATVIPAYQSLFNKVQAQLSQAPQTIGVGQFDRGAEYYQWALRHHSTSDLTAQEVHDLGVAELQRIRNEMRMIFDELGYPQDESLQQLYARVATDGGIVPASQALARYESLIEFARDRLDVAFDIFPEFDVVVEPDPSGGYYIRPSLDGSRPGAFYAGTTERPYYDMPTLTFHEALPGHHTQIALALEQDAPFFRKLINFTGFVEGWALYAERLAYELGWYDNDVYGNLGRLQFEALRAARLVMDTGIHNLGWSYAEATQFNEDNVGWSFGASQGAALRYSVYTGQATAYYIGMLRILEERQRAMDELGTAFDLKAFHRAVLTNGAVPLSLLDSVVDGYIQETLAGQ